MLPGNEIPNDTGELQKLNNGYDSTKFCSRYGSNYNPKFNDPDGPEDECCKIIQECDFTLQFGHYRHGYLNVYPYDLHDCECTRKFEKCLNDLGTTLAKELHKLFFQFMNKKCFDFVPRKICTKYSTWFDECEEEIDYLEIKVQNVIFVQNKN